MNKRGLIIAMRFLGLGWYVVVSILLGVGGGLWMDAQLNVSPVFTLLGVLLGSGLAFYGLYRMVEFLFKGDD